MTIKVKINDELDFIELKNKNGVLYLVFGFSDAEMNTTDKYIKLKIFNKNSLIKELNVILKELIK